MKKALAGPAKPAAKKQPERRAMIAAVRRLIVVALAWVGRLTLKVDRLANLCLERVERGLGRFGRRVRSLTGRFLSRVGRRVRPAAALLFGGLACGERLAVGGWRAGQRFATRASSVLTPIRAICLVTVAAAICLTVSQFIDYRAIEVGQPSYADLPSIAPPPTVAARTAGEAHSYLLVPLALLAAALAVAALSPRRRALAGVVVVLGLASLAVIVLIDRPSALSLGAQASRFSGAHAVLDQGFYAELAAAAALVLGGLLYYARPCQIPINLSGRVASSRRRRRRRQASSRARDARKGSPRRSGAASAPASRP